jgi:hypothetical protein
MLLEVEESFASEKRKVDDLTKELFLVEDTHASLKRDNDKLQESLTSLQVMNTALEVKVSALLVGNILGANQGVRANPCKPTNKSRKKLLKKLCIYFIDYCTTI